MQRLDKLFLIRFAVVLVGVLLLWCPASDGAEIKKQILNDGVVKWSRPSPDKPMFFKVVEEVFRILPLNRESLPFGRSIAFLVGVSDYKHISPDLPFVKNDLEALRKYLLERGGFDEVYVAAGKVVSASLVSDYMMNRFTKSLSNRDRLLFYYSGHGKDMRTGTGYMQFAGATPTFDYQNYLAIKNCNEWSRILPVKHALFIFDCCASGLVLSKKSDEPDAKRAILKTLSGDGSRTVITAGTADQESFGVGKHSVFTLAFLNALKGGMRENGFMTINQVFARLELEVGAFCAEEEKRMTPNKGKLGNYSGAFLFVDRQTEKLEMSPDIQKTLNAKPVKKSGSSLVKEFGLVQVACFVSGKLFVDEDFQQNVKNGDGLLLPVEVGDHTIKVHSSGKVYSKPVFVVKGRKEFVTITKEEEPPPLKASTLRVESEMAGAVITINGKNYGKAPQEFTIDSAGKYEISVAKPGYETFEEVKHLKLGERYVVKARFPVTAAPSGSSSPKKSFKNKLGMEFVHIPSGEFMMGSPENEPGRGSDEKQHKVTLTKGFYMQTTPVTVGQWKAFVKATDYKTEAEKGDGAYVYAKGEWNKKKDANWRNPYFDQKDDHPVVCISWNDANAFIQWLNSKEKLYRLPTEAQWEYACRAGTATPFWTGQCLDAGQANYNGNYPLEGCPKGTFREKTTPVTNFSPNPWGLFDMHGNVWEWCQDWYGEYPEKTVVNPTGPQKGSYRVIRGGSWFYGARYCRSALRGRYVPSNRGSNVGFRLLREAP